MFAVKRAGIPRVPRLVVGVLGVNIVEVGVCMDAVTSDGVLGKGVLGVPSIATVVFMVTTSLDMACPTLEVISAMAAVSDVEPVMRNYIPVYRARRVYSSYNMSYNKQENC